MATTEPTASAAYHASLETLLRLATVAKDRALRYARRESTIDHYHDAIDVLYRAHERTFGDVATCGFCASPGTAAKSAATT